MLRIHIRHILPNSSGFPSTSHVPVPCSNGSSGAIGFWASALTCTNPRMNQAPSFTDSRTLHSPKGHYDTGMMPFVSSCGSHGKLQGKSITLCQQHVQPLPSAMLRQPSQATFLPKVFQGHGLQTHQPCHLCITWVHS